MKLLALLTLLPLVISTNLEEKWGGLWPFQGIATFAHLEHFQCLIESEKQFDIGIIGVPFDTAVSYRPGARFGPRAIRMRLKDKIIYVDSTLKHCLILINHGLE